MVVTLWSWRKMGKKADAERGRGRMRKKSRWVTYPNPSEADIEKIRDILKEIEKNEAEA